MLLVIGYPYEVFAFEFVGDFALFDYFYGFGNGVFDELAEVLEGFFLLGV